MTQDDKTSDRRPETRGGYLSGGGHQSTTTLSAAHDRIRELEQLCAEVYVAAVEIGLPDPLLQKLWRVAAGGTLPQAFVVDLPDLPPRARPATGPGDGAPPVAAEAIAEPPPGVGGGVKQPAPLSRLLRKIWPGAARSPQPQVAGLPTGGANGNRRSPTELMPLAQRYTVLVADDDPAMLQLLAKILQRENFDIVTANDGVEALAKAEEIGPAMALLVTDYDMPGLTGRELADRVLAMHPGVKVLFQTGFSDALFSGHADLGDAAAFLEKPFTARGLREAARFVLFGTLNP
ncbi:MAG: response regulator [Acidobacteriota bacterium]|nr:response regulator [Acidobacteriota bacterium]